MPPATLDRLLPQPGQGNQSRTGSSGLWDPLFLLDLCQRHSTPTPVECWYLTVPVSRLVLPRSGESLCVCHLGTIAGFCFFVLFVWGGGYSEQSHPLVGNAPSQGVLASSAEPVATSILMIRLAVSPLGDRRCMLGAQRKTERWHESGVPEARPRNLLLPGAERPSLQSFQA